MTLKVADLLAADRIVVPVKGPTLRLAAGELVRALAKAGALTDTHRFEALVSDTLPRDVVTVGQAFLLYFRTDAVPSLMASMGIAAEPMHREHDPTKQARIVLIIAAPPTDSSRFLRAVSAFSYALGRDEVVEGLLSAKTAADVLSLEPLSEVELRGYLTVRDVMVYTKLVVRPDSTLGDAARLMVANGIPSLVVVTETGEVLGSVGHREVLRHLLPIHVKRLAAGNRPEDERKPGASDPGEIPVRDVMDRSVLCLSEDQTVAEVATMMLNRNIDRFPVVRDGALIGFLTRGDIVRQLFGS